MKRIALLLSTAVFCGCSGGSSSDSHAAGGSQYKYLALVQATYGPARNGKSGAPVDALTISGTISNKSKTEVGCNGQAFILTDAGGESFTPVSTSCEVPEIAPNNAAAFSVVFRTPMREHMRLHFEHDDGTYEIRDLQLPVK